MKIEMGTVELSTEQAEHFTCQVMSDKGTYADIPVTNGCVKYPNGVTLRKLPVKFRRNNPRSKAFRLKGEVKFIRPLLKHCTTDPKKSVSMTIKMENQKG